MHAHFCTINTHAYTHMVSMSSQCIKSCNAPPSHKVLGGPLCLSQEAQEQLGNLNNPRHTPTPHISALCASSHRTWGESPRETWSHPHKASSWAQTLSCPLSWRNSSDPAASVQNRMFGPRLRNRSGSSGGSNRAHEGFLLGVKGRRVCVTSAPSRMLSGTQGHTFTKRAWLPL